MGIINDKYNICNRSIIQQKALTFVMLVTTLHTNKTKRGFRHMEKQSSIFGSQHHPFQLTSNYLQHGNMNPHGNALSDAPKHTFYAHNVNVTVQLKQ